MTTRTSSYRPAGTNNLYREITVPLVKHPGMSLRLVYQDPMGNYFHSLLTTAPLTIAIAFIILMLFVCALASAPAFGSGAAGDSFHAYSERRTWTERGERSMNGLRTSSALDMLLTEIQNAREQRSRLDTLIRSYVAQDTKTGLSNRLFFDNQLATLLEDQEKVGSHGVVMMVRLPDFTLLRDSWGITLAEEQISTLINLLSTFMTRYPGALLALTTVAILPSCCHTAR
jgi:RNase E specificity factor CsrD